MKSEVKTQSTYITKALFLTLQVDQCSLSGVESNVLRDMSECRDASLFLHKEERDVRHSATKMAGKSATTKADKPRLRRASPQL